MAALADYARLRDQLLPRPDEPELLRVPRRETAALRRRLADLPAARRRRRRRRRRAGRPRGCTTCATPSRSPPCSAGIAAGEDVQAKIPSLSTYLGHREPALHLLVPLGRAGAARAGRRPPGHRVVEGPVMTADRADAAGLLHRPARPAAPGQPAARSRPTATPCGCCSGSCTAQTGKPPSELDWDDLDADDDLRVPEPPRERAAATASRTRNVRLTAIRSLFSYAALRHPEHALLIQRVLAIPPKRFDKRIVTFLTAPEIDALLAAPDQARWEGRRDRALMLLAVQTGLRVSELTGLNCARHHPRRRRQRPLRGQRPQAARRSPHRPGRGAAATLAQRTSRAPHRSAVPDPHRAATQPRRRRAPRQHPRQPPRQTMPIAAGQTTSIRTSCGTAAPCRCSTPASTPPSSPSGSATPASGPPTPTSTPT